MLIHTVPSGPFATNSYVVACPKTHQAAIIDAAQKSVGALESFIAQKQLKPKYLLLTHSHWDHIAEANALKKLYQTPVCIHPFDAPNLEIPGSDGLPCWIDIPGVIPDIFLQDGQLLPLGETSFTVIHTPGHSPGGVCFYFPREHILFSGDTLFRGTIGNLSFPTCSPADMWPSLNKLAVLPPETRVFPGHGPETTIGAEGWLARAEEIFGQ